MKSQTTTKQTIKGGLLSPAWIFAGALMAATGCATGPEVGSSEAQLLDGQGIALEHLKAVDGDPTSFEVTKVSVDRLGMTHVRVQQMANGTPVLGGEAIVHLNPDDSLFGITDNFVDSPRATATPAISAAKAITLATRLYGCESCLSTTPQADLVVFRQDGRDSLVYRVQMRREDGSANTAMPVFFMDATTGKRLFAYDNLQTAVGGIL